MCWEEEDQLGRSVCHGQQQEQNIVGRQYFQDSIVQDLSPTFSVVRFQFRGSGKDRIYRERIAESLI